MKKFFVGVLLAHFIFAKSTIVGIYSEVYKKNNHWIFSDSNGLPDGKYTSDKSCFGGKQSYIFIRDSGNLEDTFKLSIEYESDLIINYKMILEDGSTVLGNCAIISINGCKTDDSEKNPVDVDNTIYSNGDRLLIYRVKAPMSTKEKIVFSRNNKEVITVNFE